MVYLCFKKGECMRTIFGFQRILHMWSLFWGFWTIAISFLVPSRSGFGRAAQKVVYQVGNLFGDQGLHRALDGTLAHRPRRSDNRGITRYSLGKMEIRSWI